MNLKAFIALGWSPIFAVVPDGARKVLQVTGWTGGAGTVPATGMYVAATGFDTLIANGVDISGGGGSASLYSSQNKDSVNLTVGAPIAQDVSGTGFVRANATTNAAFCVGLLYQDIATTLAGNIITSGIITVSDWTTITGAVSLTPRAKYYLSTTGGKLTTTPPSSVGNSSQVIGTAVDTQTMEIQIGYPILL